MDDTIAEGPHARAKKIYDHTRVASWPWVASTMRLSDNIRDLQEIAPSLGIDIEVLWRSWKSLLQVRAGQRGARNMRVTTKKFRGMVYHMSHSEKPALAALEDADGGMANELVAAEGGEAKRAIDASRSSDVVRLLRQFLSSALHVGDFVSIPMQIEDGSVRAFVCEVLERETRNKLVTTYKREGDLPELYRISIQPLEQWRPISSDPANLGNEIECFVYAEPCKLDILRLMGPSLSVRAQIMKWSCKESDVEGCMCLYGPQVASPKVALGDPSVPALCLLDALEAAAWVGDARLATHAPGGAKRFDNRNAAGRRPYLQCVLASDGLFRGSVTSFRSNNPLGFYQLLLATKRDIPEGQPAVWYREMLDKVESASSEALSALLALPPIPLQALGDGQAPQAIADHAASDSSDGVVGGEVSQSVRARLVAEPIEAPPPEAEAMGVIPGASANSSAAGSRVAPEIIEGSAVRRVRGRLDEHWSYHERLSVQCNNASHREAGCSKSRSLNLDVSIHGPNAAHLFLGAWLRQSALPVDQHKKYKPTVAEVREYARSVGE